MVSHETPVPILITNVEGCTLAILLQICVGNTTVYHAPSRTIVDPCIPCVSSTPSHVTVSKPIATPPTVVQGTGHYMLVGLKSVIFWASCTPNIVSITIVVSSFPWCRGRHLDEVSGRVAMPM